MIKMFQQDNRATKVVFGVVIGFAILAMVITLVPGIFDNGSASNGTTFATVRGAGLFGRISGDSTTITNTEVENTARGMLRQQQLPDYYLPLILQRAGQEQVERAVLVREADHLGLQVSNDDLSRELHSGPLSRYLFPNGQFIGTERYEDFVQQAFGISVVQFETEVKQDLELQRLQALVTGGVSISEQAARSAYMKQGEKVKFDYAVVALPDVKKTINPGDADLEQYFKSNGARYATAVPEQRKIAFFTVDASNLPGGAPKPSDADIQAYYTAHQADYKQAEQVKTRHILVAVKPGVTDAQAKAKAEDLLKQVKGGGNFAELAKKNSDDPSSAAQGGELPMIPTASLDPAYGKAAMALNPGQTSDLVRSQFGYHIIQTEQKQTASTKPLSEVHDEIAGKIAAQAIASAQSNFANQLAADAKKNGLDATAKAHNLHLTTSDFVGRGGNIASLPDSSALISAAFGASKGAAPQAVSAGDSYAVFQVIDVQAAHAPTFADWKTHVLDDYRDDKAPALLRAQIKTLDDSAKQMGSLQKAAAKLNIPVKTSDLVGRDAQVQDLGSLGGAAAPIFDLAANGISGPIDEGPNAAVVQLLTKQQPDPGDITAHVGETRDKLLDEQRAEFFNVFAGTLMDRYERAGAIVYSRKPTGLPIGS